MRLTARYGMRNCAGTYLTETVMNPVEHVEKSLSEFLAALGIHSYVKASQSGDCDTDPNVRESYWSENLEYVFLSALMLVESEIRKDRRIVAFVNQRATGLYRASYDKEDFIEDADDERWLAKKTIFTGSAEVPAPVVFRRADVKRAQEEGFTLSAV